VVLNPANCDRITLQILEYTRLVGPKARPNILGEPWSSFLGRENEVDAQNVQRLRHSGCRVARLSCPSRAKMAFGDWYRGRVPPPTMVQAGGLKSHNARYAKRQGQPLR